MISLYTIIILNVFGALEVLLPLLFLYFLRRYKTYKISSVICGLALYFIITYMLSNSIFTIIRAALGEMYFIDHPLLGIILDSVITSLAFCPLAYLLVSRIRRGKWNLYDTIAMGTGYWLIPQLMGGAMEISSASLLQRANQGTLEELASEAYPLELLQALVDGVKDLSPLIITLEHITSLLSQWIILMVLVSLCVSIFYIVKRKRKKLLYVLIPVHFVLLMIINCSSTFITSWLSLLPVLAVGLLAAWYLYRFFRFYRSQQVDLIRRRKEFKEEQHRKYEEELQRKREKEKS